MFTIVKLFARKSLRPGCQPLQGSCINLRHKSTKNLSPFLLRVISLTKTDVRSINSSASFIKRYQWRFRGIYVGLCVGAGAGAGYYLYSHRPSLPIMQVNAADKILPPSVRKTMNFIVEIVEKVAPSVVLIETMGTQQTMFGTAVFQGAGSGFIVRSDGLILTNAHVVQRSRRVKVQMYDGKIYDGEVEYFDITSDLATVKIKANNLPVIKLANSKEAKAGEIVIALGSPLSLSNSVTFGIISNTQRRLENMPFSYIQTDAAITTGNSGGPLVNLDGEAVGISSMTVANAPGISFAIPSDHAKEFLEKTFKADSKQKGVMSMPANRKQIGVTMFALDAQVLKELKFRNKYFSKVDHGILIHTIQIGSPAHKSGIEPGDIIVQVDGKSVYKSEDLMTAIQDSTGALDLTIVRNNKILNLKVIPEVERD